MLTRIEIDGFKSFRNFQMDFRPFTVILGPNASGKSNLFDAIQLLSRSASQKNLNETLNNLRGQPHELFRIGSDGKPETTMRFAVEVLLDSYLKDAYGTEINIPYTRLRYELIIKRDVNSNGMQRLYVVEEKVDCLKKSEDFWQQDTIEKSPLSNRTLPFHDMFIKRSNRRQSFLTTTEENGVFSFQIFQEGHGGSKRIIPAVSVEATVLSSIRSAKEFPTLFALQEEFISWRFLHLDHVDLRKSSGTLASDNLEQGGANLPTVLAKIRSETKTDIQESGVLSEITADLVHLIPGVRDISVKEDKRNQEYYVEFQMRDGPPFSARVVSDGTLRVLALLTLLHDPRHRGLVCFEEPENGIHPLRLREMIKTMRNLVTNLYEKEYDEDEPLRQIIVNSHSPVVLACLEEREMTFFSNMTNIDPSKGITTQRTHARKVKLQGELWPEESMDFVSAFDVDRFLGSAKREVHET